MKLKVNYIWWCAAGIYFAVMLWKSQNIEKMFGDALAAGLIGGFSALIYVIFGFIMSAKKTETELMGKVKANDINSCVKLLDEGADIDAVDEKGATALIYAVLNTDTNLVKLLVDRGADIDMSTKKGVTAESIAKGNNLVEISQILNTKKSASKKSFLFNLFK